MQKVSTAVAVLQLVERALGDLDADADDYVPFTVRRPVYPDTPITIRVLLSVLNPTLPTRLRAGEAAIIGGVAVYSILVLLCAGRRKAACRPSN